MKHHVMTVALSVLTTVAIMSIAQSRPEPGPVPELVVDRLVVRKELIVSDTGEPWEKGFERHQIARGIYARSQGTGAAGLWVRGRLIQTELDDPFDVRFHAMNSDGTSRTMPAHISWNIWAGDNWRQVAIISGEALEESEAPRSQWDGGNHPGRLRFQSFRPHHPEPMTDAVIGQGMMSIGGGGFGGDGLPYPSEALQVWGGGIQAMPLPAPRAPRVVRDDGSGRHTYTLIGVGPQGARTGPSPGVTANGLATLAWDRAPGIDAYIIVRNGVEITGPVRIEGVEKSWKDTIRDRKIKAER
jgi:hypothetical protein